jgi:hypothetical protein
MKSIKQYYDIEIRDTLVRKEYYNNLFQMLSDSISAIKVGIEKTKADLETVQDPVKQRKLRTKLSGFIETQYKVKHLKDSIEYLKDNPRTLNQLKNERNIKWARVPEKLVATGVKLSWFSFGYKLVNKNFYLFDSSKIYAEEVTKHDFTAHQLTIDFNHFSWNNNSFGSWFLGIGLAFQLDDNQASLDKTEITETYTYAGTPKSRSEQKKYTAFYGDYKKDLRSVKPYIEFYYFILNSHTVALHLYPEVEFTKNHQPLTNIGTGLFFTFADKNDKEGKAKVNAELYFKFNDIHNNLETENYKFYERNDIGVRLTFPFNFNL